MGIEKSRDQYRNAPEQQMRHLPFNLTPPSGPEGAVIETSHGTTQSRIAVYYDHAAKPPVITISRATWPVQTVLADGVAVAVVAGAHEPELQAEDVILIARYTAAG